MVRNNNLNINDISETGNWNMAQGFIEDLHLKLKESDYYKTIARFGYESIFEELTNINFPRNEDKLRSLKRLNQILIDLILDSKAFVKKFKDKEEFEAIKNTLEEIKSKEAIEKKAYEIKKDYTKRTSTIKLLPYFSILIDALSELRSKMIIILNNNDLIFPGNTQFDLESYKKSISHRMVTQG